MVKGFEFKLFYLASYFVLVLLRLKASHACRARVQKLKQWKISAVLRWCSQMAPSTMGFYLELPLIQLEKLVSMEHVKKAEHVHLHLVLCDFFK